MGIGADQFGIGVVNQPDPELSNVLIKLNVRLVDLTKLPNSREVAGIGAIRLGGSYDKRSDPK
jgi:hypothetical protein